MTIAVFGYVALSQAAALLADIPVQGRTYSPITFAGFLHPGSAEAAYKAWAVTWCPQKSRPPIASWMWAFSAFDVVFVLGYTLALWSANARKALGFGIFLGILVTANLAEDVLGVVALGSISGSNRDGVCTLASSDKQSSYRWLFVLITVATVIKWLAAAVVLIVAVYRITVAGPKRTRERIATAHAIGVQKFPLIIFSALASLLLLSGSPILDQGVDVERSWFATADPGRGWLSAGLALVGFLLLAGVLRYLSSVHVGGMTVNETAGKVEASTGSATKTRRRSTYLPWVAAPVLFYLIAQGLKAMHWARVDDRAVWVTVGVLGAVPISSFVFGRIAAPRHLDHSPDAKVRAWKIGRLIAYGTFCVLPISLSRAFVPTLLLGYGHRFSNIVLVFVPPVIASVIIFAVLSYPRKTNVEPAKPRLPNVHPQCVGAAKDAKDVRGWSWSLGPAIVTLLVAVVLLVLLPVETSTFVGVIGTFTLGFTGLSAFYGVLIIIAQLTTNTPYVFKLAGMRRAPVVSLVLVIAVISTFTATGSSLHDIRGPSKEALANSVPRPVMAKAFATWNSAWSSSTACPWVSIPHAGGAVHVRPMLFVAAEGGGIRAALWTVDAMTKITSTPCGQNSVFVASGVSGGATGIAIMDTATNPLAAVQSMTGERSLAVGVDALMSRDLLAGVFGLNVRPIAASGSGKYPDRAALMEQAWERDEGGPHAGATQLAEPFPVPAASAKPWKTVFNGTSVGNGCRVLVSDIDFGTHARTCSDPADPIPGAYDLYEAHSCYAGIATSTASLLAARFPYVTPSGIIRACPTEAHPNSFKDQIIDGGYSENSGVDTLNEMLTNLMPSIRAANARAVAPGSTDRSIIVPMVVFLHNSATGPQPLERKVTAKPELLVPPTVGSSGEAINSATSTLLQRSQNLTASIFPDGSGAATRYGWLTTSTFASRAMTVGPQLTPQVALPLGWALSQETITTMSKALTAYLNCSRETQGTTVPCSSAVAFNQLAKRLGIID